MKTFLAILILFALLVLLMWFYEENGETAEAARWRSDKAVLEQQLPLITPIESCKWKFDKKESGGFIPDPERAYTVGIVEVSQERKSQLLKSYEWNQLVFDPKTVKLPSEMRVVDLFLNSKGFLTSEELIDEHNRVSDDQLFRVVLSVDHPVLFFHTKDL